MHRGVNNALSGLCELLRVSKITLSFYESMKQEASGRSITVKYFDSGADSVVVISERILTDVMGVAICRIYQPIGAEKWTEEERERVRLIQNILFVFEGRARLRRIVDKMTFYDSDDYRNLHYYFRHIQEAAGKGMLKGKAALQFNLQHFSLIKVCSEIKGWCAGWAETILSRCASRTCWIRPLVS